jgi:hypothetical protein
MSDDHEDYYDRKVERADGTLWLAMKVALVVFPALALLQWLGVIR